MPKDPLVHAAHVYIIQPIIHTIYNSKSGGLGTVKAITTEQPIVIPQAMSSTENLIGYDL